MHLRTIMNLSFLASPFFNRLFHWWLSGRKSTCSFSCGKTTHLHMQLWAKFHRGQLLMRLVVGLMPVRLGLLHRTGKGKQSQSFKMTVSLVWMPWHPRLISVYHSFKICHLVSKSHLLYLASNWIDFQRKGLIFFLSSSVGLLPMPCPPVLIFWIIHCHHTSLTVSKTRTFYLSF